MANLEVYKNTNFEKLQTLFDITQKLILDYQTELLNVTPVDWTAPSWVRSKLSHDQVITWTKAKVLVCSDSLLCLVKTNDSKGAIDRWEGQVEEFKMSASYKELSGIDGEPIEFEWNIFPGFNTLQLYGKVQDLLSTL